MSNVQDWLGAARLRARRQGYGELGDSELLALLLCSRGGPAALKLASRVLEELGSLHRLGGVGFGRLNSIAGLSSVAAERLVIVSELARRIRLGRVAPRRQLVTPSRVAEWMTPRIGLLEEEELWVLAVDGRNYLRGMRCAARGGAHGLSVTARDVLRAALCEGACAFVVVHNHPSGDHLPSRDDLRMTRQLRRAAEAMAMPLLDHVIVTADGRYSSLFELGELGAPPQLLNSPGSSVPSGSEVLLPPSEASGRRDLPSCCLESPAP